MKNININNLILKPYKRCVVLYLCCCPCDNIKDAQTILLVEESQFSTCNDSRVKDVFDKIMRENNKGIFCRDGEQV